MPHKAKAVRRRELPARMWTLATGSLPISPRTATVLHGLIDHHAAAVDG